MCAKHILIQESLNHKEKQGFVYFVSFVYA